MHNKVDSSQRNQQNYIEKNLWDPHDAIYNIWFNVTWARY